MTGFLQLPDIFQSLILLFVFSVFTIDIFCVVKSIILRARLIHKAFNGLLLLASSVFLVLLSALYLDEHNAFGSNRLPSVYNKPALPIIIILSALFIASVISIIYFNNWTKSHITPASIKEGMDKLPSGLCYHSKDGVPRFINHRMDKLCRYITGDPLFDANDFWSRITTGDVVYGNIIEKSGYDPIITILGGTTISFTKAEREIAGETMYEIRATDITKQFSLYNELQQSNNKLRNMNMRLRQYGENVWDITREREILTAKVNIHDMLGKSLLITKRYIENGPVDVTKQQLIDLWRANVAFFNGDIKENNEKGTLDELYSAAKIMGISIFVEGDIPKDNQVLRFLMSGARECLTNAVHHAGAKKLNIKLSKKYGYDIIEYTNDGKRPNQPIREGGGLSSLRQGVENEGGIMETEHMPEFILRLKIPSREGY